MSAPPEPEATWSLPPDTLGAQQERGYFLPSMKSRLQQFAIYETSKVRVTRRAGSAPALTRAPTCRPRAAAQSFQIVGFDKSRTRYRLLIIDRTTPDKLEVGMPGRRVSGPRSLARGALRRCRCSPRRTRVAR